MPKAFGLWFIFVAVIAIGTTAFSGWCLYKVVTWVTSGAAAQQVHTATH